VCLLLTDFKNGRDGFTYLVPFVSIKSLNFGLEPVFCDGTNLVDHGNRRTSLACDGNGDWGMRLGRSGERNDDDRAPKGSRKNKFTELGV